MQTESGPALRATRCLKCGKIQFPAKTLCTDCLDEESEDIPVGKYAKIFSFTTTYGQVSRMESPVTAAFLELPEGIRVFAPLKKEENIIYEIGTDMELDIDDLWEEENAIITGYVYKVRKEAAVE